MSLQWKKLQSIARILGGWPSLSHHPNLSLRPNTCVRNALSVAIHKQREMRFRRC